MGCLSPSLARLTIFGGPPLAQVGMPMLAGGEHHRRRGELERFSRHHLFSRQVMQLFMGSCQHISMATVNPRGEGDRKESPAEAALSRRVG